MAETDKARVWRWEDVELEEMAGTINRRFVTSDKLMIAQITIPRAIWFLPTDTITNRSPT